MMSEHDELDPTLRAALRAYRTPPEPPREAMGQAIEAQRFGVRPIARRRGWGAAPVWLAAAAALVVGIGLGRYAMPARTVSTPAEAVATNPAPIDRRDVVIDTQLDVPYEVATSRYLGQTAALLTSLPELGSSEVNVQFSSQARDLLQTTRLLLDSPAGDDPELRALLSDLELVLAQIAGLRSARDREELDLITGALEQRDVLPRLKSVVAQISYAGD
jgi:hypothetical protein